MKLMQYIRSDRKGEDARDVEMEVLRDRFLSDAVDGFDSVGESTEVARDLAEMHKEITSRSFVRRPKWLLWGAISLVVCASVVLFVLYYYGYLGGAYAMQTEVKSAPAPENVTQGLNVVEKGGDVAALEGAEPAGSAGHAGDTESTDMAEDVAGGYDGDEREVMVAADGRDDKAEPEPVPAAEPLRKEPEADTGRTAPDTGKALFVINTPDPQNVSGYLTSPRTGFRKYNEYIQKARMLPEESERGDVTVTFWVNQYGRPSSMRVDTGPSKAANTEAIRLLDAGPEWYPTEERVSVTISLK